MLHQSFQLRLKLLKHFFSHETFRGSNHGTAVEYLSCNQEGLGLSHESDRSSFYLLDGITDNFSRLHTNLSDCVPSRTEFQRHSLDTARHKN